MFTNREDLAWVSGFFDGEGCFTIRQNKYGKQYAMVTVSQVHREVLEKCQRITGLGTIGGPYQAKQPNRQPSYRWRMYNFEQVQALLAMMWPWLGSVKRKQAVYTLNRDGSFSHG